MLLQKWSTSSMMALMPLILNWINFMSYMTVQSKTNVSGIKVFNFVIPGQVVKNGFGGLVWLKFWHRGTGHSLFVVWMSLQQQNVLFDRATLPKPKSSFRDKGVTKIWWQILLHYFLCLSSTLCTKRNLHQWKLFILDTWNIDFAFLDAKFYALLISP